MESMKRKPDSLAIQILKFYKPVQVLPSTRMDGVSLSDGKHKYADIFPHSPIFWNYHVKRSPSPPIEEHTFYDVNQSDEYKFSFLIYMAK